MRLLLALIIVLGLCAAAQAQRAGRGLSGRFERNSPQIGSLLPDISAYDENGKKFKLRNLKGHYSVLVFGCLT